MHLKRIWNVFGACLELNKSAFGAHLEYNWNIFRTHLERIWSAFGAHLECNWNIFRTHLKHIWNVFGAHLERIWSALGAHTELSRSVPRTATYFLKRGFQSYPVSRSTRTKIASPWSFFSSFLQSQILLEVPAYLSKIAVLSVIMLWQIEGTPSHWDTFVKISVL